MRHPARLLVVTLLLLLSSCSLGPGAGEPSPPAASYVMNIGGGGLERVTAEAGDDLQPVWSPDGRRLAFVRRAAVPAAGPPWWRTAAAVLGVLAVRLAVGAVVVGVVVCALKGWPLSALAGVLAAGAAWVTFTQAPAGRQAEQVGGLVLGMVLYGGLAALLVGVVRPARPGSRWMRVARRGGREPMGDGSTRSGSGS
jgi:WD40-like Beta Propeller Repeat